MTLKVPSLVTIVSIIVFIAIGVTYYRTVIMNQFVVVDEPIDEELVPEDSVEVQSEATVEVDKTQL